ncbi:HNH endonuclease [Calidifontibacter sp. DB0510]|uniref:HNH endonuclease n=1 Tax=Metallococcus carri TaxID=1656884 RepID=A0A967EA37_9MICO|nr:HNH endonuclease signature motif containing protein [Metallococcus carri]NHN55474.1 HNH endonuclease [Metallococcus carri]NOP38342.1 HNH endonuclease [Calidifontibacter sp. DB2511S]
MSITAPTDPASTDGAAREPVSVHAAGGIGAESTGAREFIESVLFEDGLPAAMEVATDPEVAGMRGFDLVEVQLAAISVLTRNVFDRLSEANPFAPGAPDRFFADTEVPTDPRAGVPDAFAAMPESLLVSAGVLSPQQAAEVERSNRLRQRYLATVAAAHAVAQQALAVRARAVARFARFDQADPADHSAAGVLGPTVEHPVGYQAALAHEEVGPALGLGDYEAGGLIEDAALVTARLPRVLEQVGAGEVNWATATTLGREVADARPETCEQVEDLILQRGVQYRARSVARRSARTLVERLEASAARRTKKRTQAQQTGVWLDPHSVPGLALLTAAMPTAQAAALRDAVEARAAARRLEYASTPGGDPYTLGEHRAAALFELAMHNVSLTVHVDVLKPQAACNTFTPETPDAASDVTANATEDATDVTEDATDGTTDTDTASDADADADATEDAADVTTDTATATDADADEGDGAAEATGSETASTAAAGDQRPGTATANEPNEVGEVDEVDEVASPGGVGPEEVVQHPTAGPITGSDLAELIGHPAFTASKVTTSHRNFDAGDYRLDDQAISKSYRPPESMRERVKRRDQRCRFPGCTRGARFTDLDHVVAWPQGPTADWNLQCLCRRHHRTKQSGWSVTMTPGGRCTWTSPAGRVYVTWPGLLETYWDTTEPSTDTSDPDAINPDTS